MHAFPPKHRSINNVLPLSVFPEKSHVKVTLIGYLIAHICLKKVFKLSDNQCSTTLMGCNTLIDRQLKHILKAYISNQITSKLPSSAASQKRQMIPSKKENGISVHLHRLPCTFATSKAPPFASKWVHLERFIRHPSSSTLSK